MLDERYNLMLSKPIPTKKENLTMLHRALKEKSDEACWALALANIKLVANLLFKYYPNTKYNNEQHNRLFSAGVDGLFTAIKRLRKRSSLKSFYNYTYSYIHGTMQTHIRNEYYYSNHIKPLEGFLPLHQIDDSGCPIVADERKGPVEELMLIDSEEILDDFIIAINKTNVKLSVKQEKLLRVLVKTNGNLKEMERLLNISKQMMWRTRNTIRIKAQRFLHCNPELFESLFGTTKRRDYDPEFMIKMVERYTNANKQHYSARQRASGRKKKS